MLKSRYAFRPDFLKGTTEGLSKELYKLWQMGRMRRLVALMRFSDQFLASQMGGRGPEMPGQQV